MTRVVLDTNLLISYLLNPVSGGPPAHVVRAAIAGTVVPIVGPQLVNELKRKLATKPYLSQRISVSRMNSFIARLLGVAEYHEDADIRYPAITRDPKDDYLIANAVVYRADYLVSGDHDLLVLGEFEVVRLVSPAAFVGILDTARDTDIS